MFIHSTGQIGSPLLNLGSVRVDVMNKVEETTQIVSILFFNTATSPKTLVSQDTFSIPPSSGASRTFTPPIFPNNYEIVVRTNNQRVIPYITGIDALGLNLNPSVTFKYGDLFVYEIPGTIGLGN
ncbi:hypothetical protein [Metabacillus elymi]|uniref:DUF4183 domain-containing protein n=1 Tax=Metabacillus elymi TaxID=2745198 RepID=A0ABX6S2Z1_9BACI|nr:hypothetical protein [Metabacillus sp. KUDC1714]QNF28465.1 hypothetical protein HUW50_13860 [Metabacillus sp. KUDC1714]